MSFGKFKHFSGFPWQTLAFPHLKPKILAPTLKQKPYRPIANRVYEIYHLSSIAYPNQARHLSSIAYRLSQHISSIAYPLSPNLSSIAYHLSQNLSYIAYRTSQHLSSTAYHNTQRMIYRVSWLVQNSFYFFTIWCVCVCVSSNSQTPKKSDPLLAWETDKCVQSF